MSGGELGTGEEGTVYFEHEGREGREEFERRPRDEIGWGFQRRRVVDADGR
jgi:hypothetical protein